MKIYKIAFNVSKDDLLASKLSREVFETVKNNIGKNIYKEINVDETCKLQLNTQNNKTGLTYAAFDISANSNFSNINFYAPTIQIDLRFSNIFSELYFDRLYYVIFSTIKHELKHYLQFKNKINHFDEDYESYFDYQNNTMSTLTKYEKLRDLLLSKTEINPFIVGIIFRSKKQGISFYKVLDEDLNRLFFRNNEEVKKYIMSLPEWGEVYNIMIEIRNVSIDKAKQLYPYLRRK